MKPYRILRERLRIRKLLREVEEIDARTFEDDYGHFLVGVHLASECAGPTCTIHRPTDHPMRGFPLLWRQAGPWDIKPSHFERICPHGVGHPDPDQFGFEHVSVHGCDGCCA